MWGSNVAGYKDDPERMTELWAYVLRKTRHKWRSVVINEGGKREEKGELTTRIPKYNRKYIRNHPVQIVTTTYCWVRDILSDDAQSEVLSCPQGHVVSPPHPPRLQHHYIHAGHLSGPHLRCWHDSLHGEEPDVGGELWGQHLQGKRDDCGLHLGGGT